MNSFYLLSPLVLQTIIWIPTRFFFWFFLRTKIIGLDNLNGIVGGVIFAQNHTSELDVFMIPSSLPFLSRLMPMFYTSRGRGYYKHSGWRQRFYGGVFFNLWGSHMVIVGNRNYTESLKTHVEILRRGKSLLVFTEGYRSKDGKIGPAKGGTAFLAFETGAPVVPVSVSGLLDVEWADVMSRSRNVVIRFGRPIYPRDLFGKRKSIKPSEFKRFSQKIVDEIRILHSQSK